MNNILQRIIAHKHIEVAASKNLTPVTVLEQSAHFSTPCRSLKQQLLAADKLGVIAEIKRQSPSCGVINANVDVEKLANGYIQAGATGLSVLTDKDFFGGTTADLIAARRSTLAPILRKDFIVDEYQLLEAKAMGADVILIIAAALTPVSAKKLSGFAKQLGLEVLLECVSKTEIIDYTCESVDIVGVNNRNLKDFTQKLELSFELITQMPADKAKIAESSIRTAQDIVKLKKAGFNGFLIGETFMKTEQPELTCQTLISEALILLNYPTSAV